MVYKDADGVDTEGIGNDDDDAAISFVLQSPVVPSTPWPTTPEAPVTSTLSSSFGTCTFSTTGVSSAATSAAVRAAFAAAAAATFDDTGIVVASSGIDPCCSTTASIV